MGGSVDYGSSEIVEEESGSRRASGQQRTAQRLPSQAANQRPRAPASQREALETLMI